MAAFKKNIPSYNSLLDSFITTKNLQGLVQIHAQTIKNGIENHYFILSKLVSAYASCAKMRQATLLFSFTQRRPTFLFNSIIRAYAALDLFSHSLAFFGRMLDAYKPIDSHTLPSVIKSCGGLNALRLGNQVHGMVLTNGFSLDLANLNALISMYGKCDELWAARKVFDGMHERNGVSFGVMMAGYEKCGNYGEVFGLFDRMVRDEVRVDAVCFTTVLSACNHGGMVEKGREYFWLMSEKFGLRPGLEHYTCVVSMLVRAGMSKEADELVMGMEVEPDEALWKALSGFSRITGSRRKPRRFLRKCRGRGRLV